MIFNQSQPTFNKETHLYQIFCRLIELLEEEKEEEQPLVLTANQAAELLQISLPTLREHLLCRPDFPKLKAGNRYLIPYKALVEWVNQVKEVM
jgi:excisionase family DNA binding protein